MFHSALPSASAKEPASTTPSARPDSAAPDSAAPDSAAPDSAAPGSAVPGSAVPGSAVPGSAAIEVDGLRHGYGAETVLAVDDWRVARGASCLVLGPSGSGKTTLLHILAGLTSARAGRVTVGGTEISALSARARDRVRARTVGLVPQRLHLIGAISVADNLHIARRLAGLPRDEARVAALLARLGVAALAKRRPADLSLGQAQRVAVARALVNAPALLLADEPTAALDDANAAAVIDLLHEAVASPAADLARTALVVASHDRRIAARFDGRLELGAARAAEARAAR